MTQVLPKPEELTPFPQDKYSWVDLVGKTFTLHRAVKLTTNTSKFGNNEYYLLDISQISGVSEPEKHRSTIARGTEPFKVLQFWHEQLQVQLPVQCTLRSEKIDKFPNPRYILSGESAE